MKILSTLIALLALGSTQLTAAENIKPSDFKVWEVAYKVSETDFNMKRSLAKSPVNKWAHQSDVSNVKTQQVIRENQDVIYSSAVVDIRDGATITVPKSDTYHIVEIIDMQNYITKVLYAGESMTLNSDNVTYGNYVYLNMRIRILPEDKGGLKETLRLQALAKIEAKSSVAYTSPKIVLNDKKMTDIRTALIKDVDEGKLDVTAAIGTPYDTNPQDHLYGTAYGWGGLGIQDAAYYPIADNLTKIENNKALPSSVTFTPPAMDLERGGFWSITTYNKEGWLAKDVAAISNSQAVANADGTYTVNFNTPGAKNNIDTPAPFVALLRVYVPKSKDNILKYMKNAPTEFIIK